MKMLAPSPLPRVVFPIFPLVALSIISIALVAAEPAEALPFDAALPPTSLWARIKPLFIIMLIVVVLAVQPADAFTIGIFTHPGAISLCYYIMKGLAVATLGVLSVPYVANTYGAVLILPASAAVVTLNATHYVAGFIAGAMARDITVTSLLFIRDFFPTGSIPARAVSFCADTVSTAVGFGEDTPSRALSCTGYAPREMKDSAKATLYSYVSLALFYSIFIIISLRIQWSFLWYQLPNCISYWFDRGVRYFTGKDKETGIKVPEPLWFTKLTIIMFTMTWWFFSSIWEWFMVAPSKEKMTELQVNLGKNVCDGSIDAARNNIASRDAAVYVAQARAAANILPDDVLQAVHDGALITMQEVLQNPGNSSTVDFTARVFMSFHNFEFS